MESGDAAGFEGGEEAGFFIGVSVFMSDAMPLLIALKNKKGCWVGFRWVLTGI